MPLDVRVEGVKVSAALPLSFLPVGGVPLAPRVSLTCGAAAFHQSRVALLQGRAGRRT